MGFIDVRKGLTMTSFVNLMASDEWSEADIVNRTEAMIASEFSPQAVAILQRKATAQALGMHLLTADEQAELARYAIVSTEAQSEGQRARADMELLAEVLRVERGELPLADASDAAKVLHALRQPVVVEEVANGL